MELSTIFLCCRFGVQAFKSAKHYIENKDKFNYVCQYGTLIENAINRNDIISARKQLYQLKESLGRFPQTNKEQKALFLYYWACCYYVENEYDKSKAKIQDLIGLSLPILHKKKIIKIKEKGNRLLGKISWKEKEINAKYYKKKKRKWLIILSCIIFTLLICMLYIIYI